MYAKVVGDLVSMPLSLLEIEKAGLELERVRLERLLRLFAKAQKLRKRMSWRFQ
jgi:hypothetical protein